MSKKNRKADKGTYALCITIGLFAGLGMTPMLGDALYPPLLGLASGFAVGHFLVRRSHSKKH